jgi:hypothetical protein
MRNLVLAPAVVLATLATLGLAAFAQTKTTESSEPGKVASLSTVTAKAQIVGLDPANRIVTLKGDKGSVFDLVAGDEVKNFDQLKLGDRVVARYLQAFSAEVTKAPEAPRKRVETEVAGRSPAGATPAIGGVRQVTVLATVVATNPPKRTMTIRGPKNTVTVFVENPMHFNVVKPGSQIAVTYTEAVALSLEPASAAKK